MRTNAGVRQRRWFWTAVIVVAMPIIVAPIRSAWSEPQMGTKHKDLLVGLGGPSTLKAGAGDDVLAGDSMMLPSVGAVLGIFRASTNAAGGGGNFYSSSPDFSTGGTKVAFESSATDLVPGDTNGTSDIYIKDLASGEIRRVSTQATGGEANGDSFSPAFSRDSGKIAFQSRASNLVPGDTNEGPDVFIKDLASGAIERVSTRANGGQANEGSFDPVFSRDGTKVAFESYATNLVPGDTNGTSDVFIKDLANGAIRRVSTRANGGQANSGSQFPVFSPDGTKVAFSSGASNFVPGDTNGSSDVFVKNLASGAIERVSTRANGGEGNSYSERPVFSPDDTKAAFESYATNLVPGDTNGTHDVFVKDLASGAIERVSTPANGGEGNSNSFSPAFSRDSREIAFHSYASNLVPGDTNGVADVFIKDLASGAIERVSTRANGGQANEAEEALSDEGQFLVEFADGARHPAHLVGRDPSTDVALLRVEGAAAPSVVLSQELPRAGALVVIAAAAESAPLVTFGSAIAVGPAWRSIRGGKIEARIELDMRLRSRAEGGLAISAEGSVLGMAVRGPRGRTLVIPSATIENAAALLLEHGEVPRGYLGLGLHQVVVTGGGPGAMVMSVDPEGPGALGGIIQGDVVHHWDGEPVRSVNELVRALDHQSIGRTVKLGVRRAGTDVEAAVTIAARSRG